MSKSLVSEEKIKPSDSEARDSRLFLMEGIYSQTKEIKTSSPSRGLDYNGQFETVFYYITINNDWTSNRQKCVCARPARLNKSWQFSKQYTEVVIATT